MDCNDCAEKPKGAVPFAAYETELARHDRHVKRLLIVIVMCILLLALTNAAWLYAWNQYDYVDKTVDLDSSCGDACYIGRDGDIIHGTCPSIEVRPNQ